MANGPALEVPPDLRSFAEKSIEQVRKAVDGFIVAAHKAVDETEQRVDSAQENARSVSRTALGFVEDNIAASFDFAAALAKATTIEQVVQLQSEFAAAQLKRYTEQAKALGETTGSAARSASGLK